MGITIELSSADTEFVKAQAIAQNISVEEFSREALMKAARNAAYVARIKKAQENVDAGKCAYFTDEELEELFNGNCI